MKLSQKLIAFLLLAGMIISYIPNTVFAEDLPDFYIKSFRYDANNEKTSAEICNRGGLDGNSAGFYTYDVRYRIDRSRTVSYTERQPSGNCWYHILPAFSDVNGVRGLGLTKSSNHEISVYVDARSDYPESDELNNEIIQNISTQTTQRPDIWIKDGRYGSRDGNTLFTVCSENVPDPDRDGFAIQTVTYSVYRNVSLVQSQSFPGRQPINKCWDSIIGMNRSGSNSLNLTTTGDHRVEVKVEIDGVDMYSETRSTNNLYNLNFTIPTSSNNNQVTSNAELSSAGQGNEPYRDAMWVKVKDNKASEIKQIQLLRNSGSIYATQSDLQYYADGSAFTFGVPNAVQVSTLIRSEGMKLRGVYANGSFTNTINAPYFYYVETIRPQPTPTPIVSTKPDMTVTGFNVEKKKDGHYYIEAKVRNIGTANSQGMNIKWFYDNKLSGYGGYGPHNIGANYATRDDNVRLDYIIGQKVPGNILNEILTEGYHTIKYCVDADNQIDELNESNNCYTQSINFEYNNELNLSPISTRPISNPVVRPIQNTSPSTPKAGFEDEVKTITNITTNPFTDTNITSLEGQAAGNLYNQGILGGYPDGEFKGNRNVNRAEALKFLLLAKYGSVDDMKNNGTFADVLEGQWYVKYVIRGYKLGIVNGYSNGTFGPERNVTTAEFLKMLATTFGMNPTSTTTEYTDVEQGTWYANYATIAKTYNLFPDRTRLLKPNEPLTRKDVAIAIYQYLKNR